MKLLTPAWLIVSLITMVQCRSSTFSHGAEIQRGIGIREDDEGIIRVTWPRGSDPPKRYYKDDVLVVTFEGSSRYEFQDMSLFCTEPGTTTFDWGDHPLTEQTYTKPYTGGGNVQSGVCDPIPQPTQLVA